MLDEKQIFDEVQNVDSEHRKNKVIDDWKKFQLIAGMADKESPLNRFTTGNFETLWENTKDSGISLVDELNKFYDTYYSSNIMKLVIVGNEPLDTLA